MGLTAGMAGCASSPKAAGSDATQEQLVALKTLVSALSARLESIETRTTELGNQVEATRGNVDSLLEVKKARPTPTAPHPAENRGGFVEPPEQASDPEAGFVKDAAVGSYRQALILFRAKKYSDANLAFSAFLQSYADHPLAGSAQFYIAESYHHQREYKLAHQEYDRVLTSYDRSPSVPDTLRRISQVEEVLKKPELAARHRQLLTSLFPQSPAARDRSAGERAEQPSSDTKTAEPEEVLKERPGAKPAEEAPTEGAANHLDGPPPTAPLPAASPGDARP